jgi:NAD(P)-dependent dehydrogenase (short-subunit alcohol dehydrogenase family)
MLQGLYRWLEHVPGRLRLRGKACLIVGAGTDVTAMIARVFAAEGCKILAVDEDEQTIRILVDLIQEEGGSATFCHATTRSVNWFAGPARPVSEDPEFLGPCRNSLHVLVSESSEGKPSPSPIIDTPIADTFARIFAKNAAANSVRVNTVCFRREPKPVSSEYDFAEDTGSAIDHQPNVTKPSLTLQIAYAALFLASDEAKLVNGASIPIDDDEINRNGFAI